MYYKINEKNQAIFDAIVTECSTSGELLKRLIPALGLTPLKLANKLKTTREYIFMLCSDKTPVPGRKACLNIALALEIDPIAFNRFCQDDAMKRFMEEEGFKIAVKNVMNSPEAKSIMTGIYKIAKSIFEAGKRSK